MDEILSSIRQIIADDDEAASQKMPVAKPQPAKPAFAAAPAPAPVQDEPIIDPFADDDDDEIAPLALSPEQIVEDEPIIDDTDEEPIAAVPLASLVVPDDVAFEPEEAPAPEPVMRVAPEPARAAPQPQQFAEAAPMPDPDLSADLAEELLEPATSAAVKSAFSRLNAPRLSPSMGLGASGLTVEDMIREMLRPMLKEWLDENLPSMVERIVEQEIERVSRGGR